MDPVEKMLIEKYGIHPEDARVVAYDIQTGSYTKGENAATYKDAKTEAYTDVANTEIQRLDRMAKNARAWSSMHTRMAKGEALTPEEQDWYQKVRQAAGQRYAGAAAAASHGRTMKFVDRGVKPQLAAAAVPGQLDRINNDIATAEATQQTSRDHIVNQLIPQPTQRPMDPNIAALIAQMGGLR